MMSEIKLVKVLTLIISSQLFYYIYGKKRRTLWTNVKFSLTENEFSLSHQYINIEREVCGVK